jgi:2-keto-4-pentenoate hydratase/2-oxohepta-3-ene-1,7-dioic acid hydratase in catechol pathway
MLRFPHGTVEPRRVFCIGRNYGSHISEMGAALDDSCIIFMKPATSLVPAGHQVTLPRDQGAIHHELEMVAAIGTAGKNIHRDGALSHVMGLSLGIDLTLREVQSGLRNKGRPWELCKAFDQSAPIGDFVAMGTGVDPAAIQMNLIVNGERHQHGSSADMIYPLERLIEILSGTWELLPGDLIYTGTPAGVGPVKPGDTLVAESPQIGRFSWTCK